MKLHTSNVKAEFFYRNYFFLFLSPPYSLLLPVIITEHPKDKNPQVGGTVTFQIKATGCCLRYQWQQKLNYPDTDFKDISGATSKMYTIYSVQKNNEGQYRCSVEAHFASGDSGRAISDPANLKFSKYE